MNPLLLALLQIVPLSTGGPASPEAGLLVLPGPVELPAGLEVQVSGFWPLRLVVLGDLFINGDLRADGPPGSTHSQAVTAGGWPGGFSWGPGVTGLRGRGIWPGCGGAPGLGGGGAGLGTDGGTGGNPYGFCAQGPDGGLAPLDALLGATRGGAGGGAGGGGPAQAGGWGGGGGGGLYVVATGTVVVQGTLSARGGVGEAAPGAGGGGGGSGGIILVRGILGGAILGPSSVLDVAGGAGGAGTTQGGAGGAGRVVVENGPGEARMLLPGQAARGVPGFASSFWIEPCCDHLPGRAWNGVYDWDDSWNPGQGPPNWIAGDLSSLAGRFAGRVSVMVDYSVGAQDLPITLTLESSADALAWAPIASFSGALGLWDTHSWEFAPALPIPPFLRVVLAFPPGGGWCAVDEIEVQEAAP